MEFLSKRLQAVADFVRQGARVADVGTDHGYLPVYLIENGISPSAVASDINEGPLNSCKLLVSQRCLQDKIKCAISNGLQNINADDIDDVIIAGMGGELIAAILSDCSAVRDKHLILNPMTHSEITRSWLYLNGFLIKNDIIVKDGKHFYNIIDAEYGGEPFEPTQTQCFLGNICDFSQKEYFNHLLNYLRNKEKGGADYSNVIKAIEDKI